MSSTNLRICLFGTFSHILSFSNCCTVPTLVHEFPAITQLALDPFARFPGKMPSSKFVEHLDPDFQTSSPQLDVRLEDIIAQSELSSRSRSTSGSSVESSPIENLGKEQTSSAEKVASSKRRSRMFTFSGR